jgi:hypothetical protein
MLGYVSEEWLASVYATYIKGHQPILHRTCPTSLHHTCAFRAMRGPTTPSQTPTAVSLLQLYPLAVLDAKRQPMLRSKA